MTQAAPSAREGTAWAGLEAVYRAELPGIRRLLTARTGSAAEADDIAQDLWLRLRAVPVGPIANPVGYLYRMALNLALDRARGERRRVAREADWGTEADEAVSSPAEQADARQRLARVLAAIETMPPGAARVFRRVRVEGASHAVVAGELGISTSAVEKHIVVALKHLARSLGD